MSAHFIRKRCVLIRILAPAVVFHEFAGLMPRGGSLRLSLMRNGGQFDAFIVLHVFCRSTKGKVRTNNTHREKERLFCLSKHLHLIQTFLNNQAIGINRVVTFRRLEYIHIRRLDTDFTMRQPMHGAPRMLPLPARHQMPIPAAGNFDHGTIIPVFPAATARVMRNLSDRHRGVSVVAEPFRHAWRNRIWLFLQQLGTVE